MVALKGLSLGNSREFNPSSLHIPWQLLHGCSLSIWKKLTASGRQKFFHPDMKIISSCCNLLNVSPLCSTTMLTVTTDRFQFGNVILVGWCLRKISETPFNSSLERFTSIWRRKSRSISVILHKIQVQVDQRLQYTSRDFNLIEEKVENNIECTDAESTSWTGHPEHRS